MPKPNKLRPLAIPVLLALAACRPAVADYTEAEAPNQLMVDSAATRFDLHFAPGSDRLYPGEAQRLGYMAATGEIRPSDRVTVAASGSPEAAGRRAAAVSSVLLRYGIVVGARRLASLPRDDAILEIGRYLVTLPPCPNWSKPPAHEFTNTLSSNYGCATASNLGVMAAYPADLVSGRPLGAAAGQPAAAAVNTYLNNKVQLPSANQALPLTSSNQATAGAGAPATAGTAAQ
ncbi:MAG: hypothetical protein JO305_00590 [Alphaproteobacteria bacterium]|nr:hypothetical protein [Alphaproteobacteria bacterium]